MAVFDDEAVEGPTPVGVLEVNFCRIFSTIRLRSFGTSGLPPLELT